MCSEPTLSLSAATPSKPPSSFRMALSAFAWFAPPRPLVLVPFVAYAALQLWVPVNSKLLDSCMVEDAIFIVLSTPHVCLMYS